MPIPVEGPQIPSPTTPRPAPILGLLQRAVTRIVQQVVQVAREVVAVATQQVRQSEVASQPNHPQVVLEAHRVQSSEENGLSQLATVPAPLPVYSRKIGRQISDISWAYVDNDRELPKDDDLVLDSQLTLSIKRALRNERKIIESFTKGATFEIAINTIFYMSKIDEDDPTWSFDPLYPYPYRPPGEVWLTTPNTRTTPFRMNVPGLTPGGRYEQGYIQVPERLLGGPFKADKMVPVDVFVPSSGGGEEFANWETISWAQPMIVAVEGSSYIARDIVMQITNDVWPSDTRKILVPARMNEQSQIVFWDRKHLTAYQFLDSEHEFYVRYLQSTPFGPIGPGDFNFSEEAIPTPQGSIPVQRSSAGLPGANIIGVLDYIATIGSTFAGADAADDREATLSSHDQYENVILRVELQHATIDDPAVFRAIVHGRQYLTVGELSRDDPEDSRLMHIEIGSYWGSQGPYLSFMNDLSGKDSWRSTDGHLTLESLSRFAH